MEFSLVEKGNEHFIKKISQFKSDIRSCRCRNFSLKQASGLMGAGGVIRTPRILPLDPTLVMGAVQREFFQGYNTPEIRRYAHRCQKYTLKYKKRTTRHSPRCDKNRFYQNYTFRRNNNNT